MTRPVRGALSRGPTAALAVAVLLVGAAATGCSGSGSPAATAGTPSAAASTAASVEPSPGSSPTSGAVEPTPGAATVTAIAAGDIACEPADRTTQETCRQRDTSDLGVGLHPDAVLVLGDDQYQDGTLEAFQQSYDPTWGRLKAVTRPAVGNHEYGTADAAGYFQYFGAAAGTPGQGWYSYDLGAWHVVVLNSNCDHVDCARDSAQVRWLTQDLADHPARCTLAYWHHPRWSDGEHGDDDAVAPFVDALYAAGADVVLSGHDHDYERLAPMDPQGRPDPTRGVRAFVVGTGGKSHYRTGRRDTTQAVDDATFGVLALTLAPTSYTWRFVPVAGSSFTDQGSADCH